MREAAGCRFERLGIGLELYRKGLTFRRAELLRAHNIAELEEESF